MEFHIRPVIRPIIIGVIGKSVINFTVAALHDFFNDVMLCR